MSDPVLYEKTDGGVAWITLNRPDVLNAINLEMRDLLWTLLHAAEEDPDVRAVIFRGSGDRAFSAGADISEFGSAPSYTEARRARRERDLWGHMLSTDLLLVAAVHGYSLGAGVELPMCCDIRVASDDATFGLPEVSLGYIPSAGGTQTLSRLIPPGIAMQMILTGEQIEAQTAMAHGLVNRVVPRERLYPEAEEITRGILVHSPNAVRLAKRAVVDGAEMPLAQALAFDKASASRALASAHA